MAFGRFSFGCLGVHGGGEFQELGKKVVDGLGFVIDGAAGRCHWVFGVVKPAGLPTAGHGLSRGDGAGDADGTNASRRSASWSTAPMGEVGRRPLDQLVVRTASTISSTSGWV